MYLHVYAYCTIFTMVVILLSQHYSGAVFLKMKNMNWGCYIFLDVLTTEYQRKFVTNFTNLRDGKDWWQLNPDEKKKITNCRIIRKKQAITQQSLIYTPQPLRLKKVIRYLILKKSLKKDCNIASNLWKGLCNLQNFKVNMYDNLNRCNDGVKDIKFYR